MSDYPEHGKLEAIHEQSQMCAEFVDWLANEKNLHLGTPHVHTEDCYDMSPLFHKKMLNCGVPEGFMSIQYYPLTGLLAEFFGIDLKKIDEEKREMLKRIRQAA